MYMRGMHNYYQVEHISAIQLQDKSFVKYVAVKIRIKEVHYSEDQRT